MPAINPMLFYLIKICDKVSTFSKDVFVFGLFFTLLAFVVSKTFTLENDVKKAKTVFVSLLVFTIISGTLGLFVPSEDTITKMIIAKNVTYERLEKIPEVTNDIRGAIKKDVIDIINAINKKETGDDDKVTM